MTEKRMPRSVAKYIRNAKARIRKTVQDPKERELAIKTLYEQFAPFIKSHAKRNE